MISRFVREQKRYTISELKNIFQTVKNISRTIDRLIKYGVLKKVKNTPEQLDMSDLLEYDVEENDDTSNKYLYVFKFVGILIVEGYVLKCYPKYITSNSSPIKELKVILKVIQKYNYKNQVINSYNDLENNSEYNRLTAILSLLNDYFENGIYTQSQNVIELNGYGEVNWDKTINNSYPLLKKGKPIYTDLYTKKSENDNSNFFVRLHKTLLTICSKEMEEADLLDLLGLTSVDLSEDSLDDIGETSYIIYRLENELNVQFNTRKRELLNNMLLLITRGSSLSDVKTFSVFGTNNFNLVWEDVCKKIFDNKLNYKLHELKTRYNTIIPSSSLLKESNILKEIIAKPIWYGKDGNETFYKNSPKTLEPDLVSICQKGTERIFIIMDAKYYFIQLGKNKPLAGVPGTPDITKQYLYQLAFNKFIRDNRFNKVKNCFIVPTESKCTSNSATIKLPFFSALKLEDIQVVFLSADMAFKSYLTHELIDIDTLGLL